MKQILTMNVLSKMYPDFVFRVKVLEICGLNPTTGEYLVIDDGCCFGYTDPDIKGCWVVVKYQFKKEMLGTALPFLLSEYKHPEPQYADKVGEYRISGVEAFEPEEKKRRKILFGEQACNMVFYDYGGDLEDADELEEFLEDTDYEIYDDEMTESEYRAFCNGARVGNGWEDFMTLK